ncbi:arabinan endo-1,5-alpha-L-arabinosidase [Dysgonomonas alginatilytica]|uniref:Arabinan endo-1,5-alpha-L-arabinosidase n=1 Tax=Dysgonomonas alginatilytica TaxID=1605892 RepID=A0A2V3PLF0_9BACT|nr:arabinan endo-1,5-alpha-L-arabinosidase [Dysgonomonas alginatilytica]PXV60186.1 arabinan endo-1,5-alpha-L-arabinosidase [Dysgonomonas alginatilytica]
MKIIGYLCIIIITVLCCCGKHDKVFDISDNPNPWEDDYRNVSSMTDYKKWGTYNIHDPSCKLFGDTYYMYSTDAIYREDSTTIIENKLPFGYIQIRKSKDLVNWEFVGWAFDKIPEEAKKWVLVNSDGRGASNIWAPYILEYKGKYRLYYSVSAFGMQTSYIGLAEADSPEGTWILKGCVVKTKKGDVMNAIDPSIAEDINTGKQWMHYGSYFGGLHCVELNPETGLPLIEGDQGHLIARRYDGKRNNIEAPEIIYNPQFKKWYLFVSYDPLVTTYNVRVGRSDSPEGPFIDLNGKDMREEEDNLPILTYPYRFMNHPGWAGVAHCSVFDDGQGKYFMAHQGRPAPKNHMMDLHVREIFWTNEGWPVVSPERYTNTTRQEVKEPDLIGHWEVLFIEDLNNNDKVLVAGQVQVEDMHLDDKNKNVSKVVQFNEDMSLSGEFKGKWQLSNDGRLVLIVDDKTISDISVFVGQDWENQTRTILFSGLTKDGKSIWGKKIRFKQ